MVATAVQGLSDVEHRTQLRRAVIASTVGTAIEWYDFFLYGTAAGLVFPKLFFPNSDPLVGTLNSFLIYGAGFAARPVGAAIFGHYGDRIGRKATLIATLMLMGIATFVVAFVPGYETIGIWGAIILTALRFIQGVGVGGEWGGSVLLAMEWSRTDSSRGFIASWPQFGVPCGLFLANLAFLAFSQYAGDQVIVRHPKEIILSAFVRLAEQAPFSIFTAFVFSYGIGTLKVSRDFLLYAVMAASVLSFVSIPLSGHISDLIGRKKMYLIGAVTVGVFGFVYFALLNTGSLTLIFIAIMLSLIPHDMMYGPQAALIAESFTGRLRYSGASLGYQLASIIAGGPAPFIATALFAAYGTGYAIAGYILACAVVTIIATTMMTDYTGKDIEGEYE